VLAFSPDGKRVGVGFNAAFVVLDAAKGTLVGYSKDDPGRFWGSDAGSIHFADDSKAFLVRHGGRHSLRSTATGQEIGSFHCAEVLPHAVPLGTSAAHDLGMQAEDRLFETSSTQVKNLQDAKRVVLRAQDNRLHIMRWQHCFEVVWTATNQAVATIPAASVLALSPDSRLLTTTGQDSHEVVLWETITGERLRAWRDPDLEARGASFAPDGRTLALTSQNGMVSICDVTGVAIRPGQLPYLPLTAAKAEQWWKDLGDDEAPRCQHALWSLASTGDQAVEFLQQRLKHQAIPGGDQVAALLADLENNRFVVRERAAHVLAQTESARPALMAALAANPGPEARRRLETILTKLAHPQRSAELKRTWRAIWVLEQVGSHRAIALLTTLANGNPQSWQADEARAALRRLQSVR
jgi:hypothetical protein